jgi:hypothetical protein
MGSRVGPGSSRRVEPADRPRQDRGPSAGPGRSDQPDEDEVVWHDEPGPAGGGVEANEFVQALWDRGAEGGEDVGLSIGSSVGDWMAEWRVEAVGARPVDHMARDLMHGALLRDHRARWFQGLARRPPEWLLREVAHLPAGQRAQAGQHLALRLMHGRQLYHVSQAAALRGASPADLDDLADLLDCRPYGVLVGWEGAAQRAHDFTCRDFRACPWCLARRAVALHDRLRRGPCRPRIGAGKHLLLARIELIIGNADDGDESLLPDRDVEQVRRGWGGRLREWAKGCGAVGGVLVHQVGPHRAPDRNHGVLHDLAVLAEVPTATAEQRSRLERATGIGSGGRPCFDDDDFSPDDGPVWIRAAAMPADHRQALRYLWAGTDAGFDLARGGIAVNGDPAGTTWGLDGAIRLQPWFLFEPTPWSCYRRAMRKRHLAVPFGTWKGALPRRWSPDDMLADPFLSAQKRAAGARIRARNRPLLDRNARVAEVAIEDRERVLEPARSAYAGLLERSRRPVGRGHLREAMAGAGHPIPERMARDLIERLRAEFGR